LPNDKGHISLSRIAERLNVLVVTCDRCGRRDQYSLWKLIAKYGPEASIELLQQEVIAGCPHKPDPTVEIGNNCAPRCPDLSNLA